MAKKKKSNFFLILLVVIFVYFIGIIVITDPKTTDAVNRSIQRKTATEETAPTYVNSANAAEVEGLIKEYESQIETLQSTISSNQMVNDLRIATLEKTVADLSNVEPKTLTLEDVEPLLDEVIPVLVEDLYQPVLNSVIETITDMNDLQQQIMSWMITNRKGIVTEVVEETLSSQELETAINAMVSKQLESVDGNQIYDMLVEAKPEFNQPSRLESALSDEEVQEFIIDFFVSNQSYFASVISDLLYDSIIDDLRLLVDNDESLKTETEVASVTVPVTPSIVSSVVETLSSIAQEVVVENPVEEVEPVVETGVQEPEKIVEEPVVQVIASEVVEPIIINFVDIVAESFFDPSIEVVELTAEQYEKRSEELREKALKEYFDSLN